MRIVTTVLLLCCLASTQTTYEDVVRARISEAQEIGFMFGLTVARKVAAVSHKDMPEMLAACDQLDHTEAMAKEHPDNYDHSLMLAEEGNMHVECAIARTPGAHF
jgi:hypothetical protein